MFFSFNVLFDHGTASKWINFFTSVYLTPCWIIIVLCSKERMQWNLPNCKNKLSAMSPQRLKRFCSSLSVTFYIRFNIAVRQYLFFPNKLIRFVIHKRLRLRLLHDPPNVTNGKLNLWAPASYEPKKDRWRDYAAKKNRKKEIEILNNCCCWSLTFELTWT